jgi:enolase
MSVLIKQILAREILDSSGWPTIEVRLELENGIIAKASSPSGNRFSLHEAKDLVDGDKKRYAGRGVLLAANHINEIISKRLKGLDVLDQKLIDQKMIEIDGSSNKGQIGSNAILAVSLACARAGALSEKKELYKYIVDTYALKYDSNKMPCPLFNIFNGGLHADTNLDFQEFLINPNLSSSTFAPSVYECSLAKVVRAASEIYHALGQILRESGYDSDVGLEGGYAPDLDSSIQAIEFMLAAIAKAGYQAQKDFNLGLDIGSSVLFNKDKSQYLFSLDSAYLSQDNLINLYQEWLAKYPINYLEDGLNDNQWEAWQELTAQLGDKMIVCGDDLFSTNLGRLREGIEKKAANATILKPNQAGTLTESIEYAKIAQRNNYALIISHRSGETNDDFITDLAVALNADYLKAGSLSRGERVAKYNRLLEIAFLKAYESRK